MPTERLLLQPKATFVDENLINDMLTCHYHGAVAVGESAGGHEADYYIDKQGRVVRYQVMDASATVTYTYDVTFGS
jgi:hypothetical protein